MDALKLVFERNQFYRRQYFLALGAFALTVLVNIILFFILCFVYKNPPAPIYFATNNVGQLINIVPVTKPNMPQADTLNWAIEAVEHAYSYDYVNYRSELQSSQKYFTNYGWRNFIKAFQASNNLTAVTTRKLVVIAKVIGQPKLIAEGILSGSYAWKWEMPVLVTYWAPPYDEKSKILNPLTVTVIVQRQSTLQSYQGLGVVQMIGELVTG
jgi:intracellular multiplication protein IcmL